MGPMDRKERIRRYKESPRPMGVFRVRNTSDGKWLIGSSVDIAGSLNRARFQLDDGSHPDRALQEDWDRTGAAGFVFETLDILEPADRPGYKPADDLRLLEAMWFEKLSASDGPGYDDESARRPR